jgi:glycosyltransferase involved in cell wall biosynthesis
MNVLFVVDTPMTFFSGIWWHRNETPKRALGKRGHSVKIVAIGTEMADEMMEWADVAVFGRTYPQQYNPVKLMTEFKKRGKRVLYDMDDDHWTVAKDNPSVLVSNALKDQYETLVAEADAILTPSKVLAKKFKKYFKKQVFICPNGIDFDEYKPRKEAHDDIIIGYMGAASHWKDLQIITPALRELSKKYDFLFTIYGMVGEPLEAAIYTYSKILSNKFQPEKAAYHQSALDFYNSLEGLRMYHIPFMPPELHPKTLSACDFDIGIAPLEDNEFNQGKSCVKYYEYAAVGTANRCI